MNLVAVRTKTASITASIKTGLRPGRHGFMSAITTNLLFRASARVSRGLNWRFVKRVFLFQMTYHEKLKDPRWQKKRLEVLESEGWKCSDCGASDKTLHVHHLLYSKGKNPWDYDQSDLISLCEECHAGAESFRDLLLRSVPYGPRGHAVRKILEMESSDFFRIIDFLDQISDKEELPS